LLLRIRATTVFALGGGAAVAFAARVLREANRPPPEPIGDPVASSWWTAGWIGLAVGLLIATFVWIWSGKSGFFEGEEDEDDEASLEE
jgi:hypothetical protein